MTGALLYLQGCSWANLIWAQLKRLRKPQYLLGMLAGLAYFGFVLARPWSTPRPKGPGKPGTETPSDFRNLGAAAEPLMAAGLLVAVALTWLLPSKRAGLDFSEAEIAWLFPAPIPRRTLVHFRLLRTQAGLVLSALVLSIVSTGMSQRGLSWRMLAGWWVIMSALELHRQAAGFARTRLLDRGVPNGVRRVAVLAVMAAVGALFFHAAQPHLAALEDADAASPQRWATLVGAIAETPGVGLVLSPFRWLARPLVADGPVELIRAIVPALGLLLGLYGWALMTAVGFEEESIVRATRRARAIEAARSGNWYLARGTGREGRAPFRLASRGFRLVALTWKNLISARSLLASPLMVAMGVGGIAMLATLSFAIPSSAFPRVLGAMILGLAPMLILVGPELVRIDLRQDLAQVDLLKTYPLRGWQTILGELLAPWLVLTAVHWLMIGAAAAVFVEPHFRVPLSLAARLAVGFAAAVLVPALNGAMLLLHNGTALVFPAWVRLGPGGAQGFEAMGQRMLLMLAHVLGLGLALLVPAGVGVALCFAGNFLLDWTVVVPLAAAATSGALVAEIVLGLKLLGDWFERAEFND